MPVSQTANVAITMVSIMDGFGFTTPELDAATSATLYNGSGGDQIYYTTNGTTPTTSSALVIARGAAVINGNSTINALKVYSWNATHDIGVTLMQDNTVLETKVVAAGANQQLTIATFGLSGANLAAANRATLDNARHAMLIAFFRTDGNNPGNLDYPLVQLANPVSVAGNAVVKGLRFRSCWEASSSITVTLYP
jgi:hypothetical protein